jgi:hypothetical protein
MELKQYLLEHYLTGKFLFTFDNARIDCFLGLQPLPITGTNVPTEKFVFNVIDQEKNTPIESIDVWFEEQSNDNVTFF